MKLNFQIVIAAFVFFAALTIASCKKESSTTNSHGHRQRCPGDKPGKR